MTSIEKCSLHTIGYNTSDYITQWDYVSIDINLTTATVEVALTYQRKCQLAPRSAARQKLHQLY